MAEYIEREAISQKIRKYYYKNPPNSSYGEGFDRGLDRAQREILNAPASDVAPMRHGQWIDKPLIKSFKHTNIPVVECSACGIDFCDIINNHYFMYKYCPNCGAKMDAI